jgi:hypothetical protein
METLKNEAQAGQPKAGQLSIGEGLQDGTLDLNRSGRRGIDAADKLQ